MYIKSPMNYIGGKYKLLESILSKFPNKIDTFVDLFAGGFNVGINVKANKIICNDILSYIIELYKYIKYEDTEELFIKIAKIIDKYNLDKENQEGYLNLRIEYNQKKDSLLLFVLICFSFNHQIRFNNSQLFNTPFGKNRSNYNQNIENNLKNFSKALKEKEIITVTIFEEKVISENKEDLEKSFNTIFPVSKKENIENLLLELLKTIDNIIFGICFINLDIEDVKNMLEDSGIAVFGTLNKNEENSEKELVKSITYPFYNKTLKDSKKILIHLDTLEDVGLAESQVIIEALRDKSEKEMEDILFSLRIDINLLNRVKCSFIAGKFRVE